MNVVGLVGVVEPWHVSLLSGPVTQDSRSSSRIPEFAKQA